MLGIVLLSVAGTLVAAPAPLTPTFRVDAWSTEDELPRSSVIAITQTRDGYLWLGTLSGLVRFDGNRFTVFDESNTPELGSSRIVFLFEDSRANLWVGTEGAGVALVRQGQIVSLDIGRGSRNGRVVSASEDKDGAVWLYTADGQLCRHHEGRIDIWRLGADRFSVLRAVAAEQSGQVWVATDWALLALDPPDPQSPSLPPRSTPMPVSTFCC